MLEEILKNIAYSYYPKGKCAITEKEYYVASIEYKNLSDTLSDLQTNSNFEKTYNLLVSEFKKNEKINNIKDVSLLDWQDRCLSFELDIFDGDRLIKICLNISLLIPYYAIYALNNKIQEEPYRWITAPQRDNLSESEVNEEINLISLITKRITKFCLFPEYLAKTVIQDLSFGEVELGNFTFYNAFFLDINRL